MILIAFVAEQSLNHRVVFGRELDDQSRVQACQPVNNFSQWDVSRDHQMVNQPQTQHEIRLAAILQPQPVSLPEEARPTLERFAELRASGLDGKDIVHELKAVGGDLKALRLALTGAERGPELWAVIAALPQDEALRRVDAAL